MFGDGAHLVGHNFGGDQGAQNHEAAESPMSSHLPTPIWQASDLR
jgi:hypothetical protein